MVKRTEHNKQNGRLSPGKAGQAGQNHIQPRMHSYRAVRLAWVLGLAWLALGVVAHAQSVTTTTVQGTVYTAAGQPASGTLQISWPAFTTAAGQAVAAGRTTVSIGADGFVSVNLAPNQGSMPAGLYYTVVYNLKDGTTNTEYWTVPAAAQATIGAVRAQLMPAAQAIQAVNKAYVDQSIANLTQSTLGFSGGTLSGPLYLNGDPSQPNQAADKHYVDNAFAQTIPLSGGAATGPLTALKLGGAYQVDRFPGSDFAAQLQACINGLSTTYGGTCDARNFTGALTMGSNVTISTANVTVNLPCATISTSNQIIVTAGTRNVTFHGCALLGSSSGSGGGNQGGTVFLYSGTGAMFKVGDSTYTTDTAGFHIDNTTINITNSTNTSTQAIAIYRSQEIDLDHLYLLGNANQTAITLDGTGNYTGGSLSDSHISGFLIGLNAIGHQITNPATTDWVNATAFLRLHIDCPTNSGSAEAGTIGINLVQGDGNTFTGGDVENCSTALHLGANAQNNTIVGLRNEGSTIQVQADTGSQYNSWITAGTMFTGKLTDNGTHNSFWDSFHRGFNGVNGDIYRSQADTTVTDHQYLGVGNGNVRGRQTEYVTDVPGTAGTYQNAWIMGLSDGTTGLQTYQIEDLLNNVNRISVGQYNNGSSTNNQTVLNAAGSGAIVLNGSNNAGTGGVVIGSGGAASSTVATINNLGNAQFNGTLLVGGTSQSTGTMSVRNNANAEVDYYLQPGATASQVGSFTYKDYNGNSQWYMLKDTSNNWALNSAPGNIDVLKAYQNGNSGDTYLDTSNSSGHIRLNYETGAGSETDIYSGGSSNLDAAFLSPTAIKLPGLAATSSKYCLQIDNSGYITNTGSPCGTGAAPASGTINSGAQGQIAVYSATGSGTAIAGVSAIPVANGGTGATTPAAGLSALGGASLTSASTQSFSGNISAPQANINGVLNVKAPPSAINGGIGAIGNGLIGSCLPANMTLTQGSTSMTCTTATFTSADAGKLLCVGPKYNYQPGYPNATQSQELCTVITAVNSATNITMADPWPYSSNITLGNYLYVYGSDDWTALNAALSGSNPAMRNKQVFLPCGIYMYSKSISQGQGGGANPQVLRGASPGQNCVILWYAGGNPSGTPASVYTGALNGTVQGATTTATTTAGTATITVTSASNIAVGQPVQSSTAGAIPYGTTVSAVSGTTVTLSNAPTTTSSSLPITFGGLSYAIELTSVMDVENIDFEGDINVQEGVLDAFGNGTRTNLISGQTTDNAFLVSAVAWSGRNIEVTPQSWWILPQQNGIWNTGTTDGDGPNQCHSCTFTLNRGTAIKVDLGSMDFYDVQASANNNTLYVGPAGRFQSHGGLLEGLAADSTTGALTDIYGSAIFDTIGVNNAVRVENGGVVYLYNASMGLPGYQVQLQPGSYFYCTSCSGMFNNQQSNILNDNSTFEWAEGSWNPSSNGRGIISVHRSMQGTTADTYTEVAGDWQFTAACTTYNSGTCAVGSTYILMPRLMQSANESWRAVFKGQWIDLAGGTGRVDTAIPFEVELSNTNNTITLSNGTVITVVENTQSAYDFPNRLVMYASAAQGAEFTGSVYIYPNTTATQPTVDYSIGQFGTIIDQTYTVSTLPACSSSNKGAKANVSDAVSPTYLGALTGGGSVFTPVVCNGSAWVSY